MTLYEIASLVTPPIIMKLMRKCLRNEKFDRYIQKLQIKNPSTLNQIIKNKERMLIIGNGPSLKETLETNIDKFKDFDCIAVNHFCETEYFQLIKPKFYLIADPAFWGDIENYADWLKEKIQTFINAIIKKTTWKMFLVIPCRAKNSFLVKLLNENCNIQIKYYNDIDRISYNENNKFYFWDKNLVSPPAQTCLNTCLYIGIFLRYKEIFLIGADTSWIELLHIDQRTNEVYTIDSHFYGSKKRKCYKDIEGKIPIKLHELLELYTIMFKLYFDLRAYADYANVKVYNASEYSLIDAFERKKL